MYRTLGKKVQPVFILWVMAALHHAGRATPHPKPYACRLINKYFGGFFAPILLSFHAR
jgi:hypothetical protein